MAKALTPLQSDFLHEIFELTQDFYLTGGTALSEFISTIAILKIAIFLLNFEKAFKHVEGLIRETCSRLKTDHVAVQVTPF